MTRRSFVGTAGLMAAGAFLSNAQERRERGTRRASGGALHPLNGGRIGDKPAIKITDIQTFLIGADNRNWLYVKVLTDQGLYGIGEAYSAGPDEATVKVIEDFKTWLVG